MASSQCCKPAEKPCNQGQQNHLLSQKVLEPARRARERKDTQNGQTTANSQTEKQSNANSSINPLFIDRLSSNGKRLGGTTNYVTPACSAKTNRICERKKGPLQKIKDGVSGHSDGSSSSSESDNDDEKCGKGKN